MKNGNGKKFWRQNRENNHRNLRRSKEVRACACGMFLCVCRCVRAQGGINWICQGSKHGKIKIKI